MNFKKIILFIVILFPLSACVQSTAFMGPGVTIATSGNIAQASFQYGTNKIIGIIELSDVARASPEMVDLLEYKIKMRDMTTKIVEPSTSGICDSCGDYFEDLRNVQGKWLCEHCRDELGE